jgi:DNA-binding protein HU-beta
MKANKALKRLAKIESLMSDVAERFSASAPHLREALKDLKAAMLSVKEAVKVQASPAAKKATPKKAARAGKNAVAKKAARKRAPLRKAAKKAALKHVAAAASSPESMPVAAAHVEP